MDILISLKKKPRKKQGMERTFKSRMDDQMDAGIRTDN